MGLVTTFTAAASQTTDRSLGCGARAARVGSVSIAIVIGFCAGACGGAGTTVREPAVVVTPMTDEPNANNDVAQTASSDPVQARAEASRALARGDRTGARRALEPLLEIPEFEAETAYNLGVIYQRAGEHSSALRFYERALSADPTLAIALNALLRLQIARGDLDGAQLALQRALSTSQNHAGIQAVGLQVGIARGDLEGVIREAGQVLLRDEANIDAHLALATAYHRLTRSELARVVINEALVRAPDRVDLWILLGNIQINEGQEVAAVNTFNQALEADPDSVEAHNNLGVLLQRAHNHRGAITHLRRAIALQPDFVEAYVNLSNSLKQEGELVEAERVIRDALEVEPAFAQAYFNLGLLYLDTEFPGMTRIERLEAAVNNLNLYRDGMRSRMDRDDPVEAYITEALAAIESERAMSTPSGFDGTNDPDDDDGGWDDGGDDDGWDDSGNADDGWDDSGGDDDGWDDSGGADDGWDDAGGADDTEATDDDSDESDQSNQPDQSNDDNSGDADDGWDDVGDDDGWDEI